MQATNERVEKFKAEAAELNLKAGSANRDTMLQSLGVVLMVAGIVVAFLGWEGGKGASDPRDVQSYTTFAIVGLTLAVSGAAVFLRYGLSKFLRLWLLRQMYEGQSHIDQVVDAIKKG
jgi:uncharacterized membrane protein YidH (DUF202 family)